jgi:hypothetical protein
VCAQAAGTGRALAPSLSHLSAETAVVGCS